jgi:hypothetical protein
MFEGVTVEVIGSLSRLSLPRILRLLMNLAYDVWKISRVCVAQSARDGLRGIVMVYYGMLWYYLSFSVEGNS